MAVAELVVKLLGDVSGFQKTMGQVGKEINSVGKNLTSSGSALTKAITLPIVGLGTAALMASSEFETGMAKVSAVSGIVGGDLEMLKRQAIELGAATQFDTKQVADGMAEFAAAGFSAQKIFEVMPGTLDLAAAGQLGIAEASNITINALSQFGLQASEAGRIADVFAKGANAGVLSVADLGESMKQVGPVAGAMNISIEETVEALAVLSNAGFKGEQAGNALKAGLLRLADPTNKMRDAMNYLGLSLRDANGNAKPFIEIISELSAKQISAGDASIIFGKEFAAAWIALQKQGPEAIMAIRSELSNADGYAREAAKTLTDNLAGDMERLGGTISGALTDLGIALTPIARVVVQVFDGIVGAIGDAIKIFSNLPVRVQNAVIVFTGIVAAVGPAALAIGALTSSLGSAIIAMAKAKTAAALLTSVGGLGAIGIAIAAIGGAIALFGPELSTLISIIRTTFADAGAIFEGWKETFINGLSVISETVSGWISDVGTWIGDLFSGWLEVSGETFVTMGEFATEAWDLISSGFRVLWDGALKILQGFGIDFGASIQYLSRSFAEVCEGIYDFWRSTINAVRAKFAGWIVDFANGIKVIASKVSILSDDLSAAFEGMAEGISDLIKPTADVRLELDKTKGSIQKIEQPVGALAKASGEAAKGISEASKQAAGAKTPIDKLGTSFGDAAVKEKELAKQTREAAKAKNDAAREAKKLEKANKDLAKVLDDLIKKGVPLPLLKPDLSGDELKKVGEEYLEGVKKALDQAALGDLGRGISSVLGDLFTNTPQDARDKAASGIVQGIKDALAIAAEDPGHAWTEAAAALAVSVTEALGPIMATELASATGLDAGVAGAIVGAVSQGLSTAASVLADGKVTEDETKQLVVAAGTAIGTAIGAYFAMPQVGAIVGTAVGTLVASALGSDSAQVAGKKAADKYFAEVFDANRLKVIVNGAITEIQDLVFSGFAPASGPVDLTMGASTAFQNLPAIAQEGFLGVGYAFEEFLGIADTNSGLLAQVLVNNIGGSLNNLQLMVQATGKTFDELKDLVIKSFLDGALSIEQAAQALRGIKRISEKGIPDGLGMVSEAFDNLKNAGVNGGRVLIDALGDMAHEAKELGMTSFAELRQFLESTGKYTKEELDILFGALERNGINSIDALANAGTQELLPVLEEMSKAKFPFADAEEDVASLKKKIDQLEGERTLKFNIRTNFDSNTQTAIKEGLTPRFVDSQATTTNAPRGGTVESFKGNAFSNGQVLPFAKGGVVSNKSFFPIGSIAEFGAEAIMPLKRMIDGRLGVAMEGATGGGTNITINAPYASPGIVETIKRELDAYFNLPNRLPGRPRR